ncbi:MAG TPA: glycoside hydrolase family 3 N-terminal domain-containing protein [Mycobacteriales bacterium]|nr:glycoside hydrolase family 3 N-terminal domain-containing protein [Mycobacteriales bacterium]
MRRASAVRAAAAILVGVGTPCAAIATPAVIPTPPPAVAHADPAPANLAYDNMSPRQRVGQLFMVGVPSTGPSTAELAHLRRLKVGSVILNGNSSAGQARVALTTARIDGGMQQARVAPFVATDQEGGAVQRLRGPGFSSIPSALRQGRWSTTKLRHRAALWARQLAEAGVSINLAPVADTVPAGHAHANQPIGRYDREYGHSARRVGSHVVAVVRGEGPHLAVTIKHFPGLGRATGNTDLAKRVTDPTTRHDSYLTAFRRGVEAGTPFVMVSLARYPHIDGNRPACFSRTVMKTMLRGALGFDGVVISDSFHAVAVRGVPARKAAVRFFRAGGTMLLDTDIAPIREMEDAVLARVKAHPAFARAIRADVITVLEAKSAAGLLANVLL